MPKFVERNCRSTFLEDDTGLNLGYYFKYSFKPGFLAHAYEPEHLTHKFDTEQQAREWLLKTTST